eukprot:3034392-Alexandrium_andersonii.AAC.1
MSIRTERNRWGDSSHRFRSMRVRRAFSCTLQNPRLRSSRRPSGGGASACRSPVLAAVLRTSSSSSASRARTCRTGVASPSRR